MKVIPKTLRFVALVYAMTAGLAWGAAPAPSSFSLLVVPERPHLIKAAFDVIAIRPVALAAYRVDAEGVPMLHAWTGEEWVPVALEDFRGGRFLIREPTRIILIGDDLLLPGALLEASNWGPLVLNVDATDTEGFLNAIGSLYAFTPAEWRWFAQRYNMQLEDVTPARESASWYDQMTASRERPPRRRRSESFAPVPVVRASTVPGQAMRQPTTEIPAVKPAPVEEAVRPVPVPAAEPARLEDEPVRGEGEPVSEPHDDPFLK